MKSKLNRDGFTYILALMMIIVMGIMLGAVGQSWKTIIKREREAELIFRGSQIKKGIEEWNKPKKGVTKNPPLNDLKNLVLDPNSLTKIRYLRKLYTDPMTGKEWTIIRDPNKGITGVASSSNDEPLKIGGFPDDLKDLSDKKKYSEWKFVYGTAATPATQATPTTPTTPTTK